MGKVLIIILFTTITGLLSNIIASWIEPIFSKRRTITAVCFIILSVIGGIIASEEKFLDNPKPTKISTTPNLPIDTKKTQKQQILNKPVINAVVNVPTKKTFSVQNNLSPQFILELDSDILNITFVPNTNYLISTTSGSLHFLRQPDSSRIDIWDSEKGVKIKNIYKSNFIGPSISIPNNGKYLYAYVRFPELNCIDIQSGKIIKSIPIKNEFDMLHPVLISKDASLLIYNTMGELNIYDNINNKSISTISLLSRSIDYSTFGPAIDLSDNKKFIIVCDALGNILLINPINGELIYQVPNVITSQNKNAIRKCIFLRNSKQFITVGDKIQLWNIDKKISLIRRHTYKDFTTAIDIQESLDLFVTCDVKGVISFWRLTTGENLGSIRDANFSEELSGLSFSSTGKYLAVIGKKQIKIWDVNKFF